MIITECPYCDALQLFGWECGDTNGYFPSKCTKCGKVMWVETTSFGGFTRTHENFKKEIMKDGDEERVDDAAKNTTNQSFVVYDE